MSMPAISLWQPWASLCVTREPCFPDERHGHGPFCNAQMVKRFETRSWPCPPNLIGQRIALHATVKPPKDFTRIGDYEVVELANGSRFMVCGAARFDRSQHIPLPLGAIVGSATIEACYPIVDYGQWPNEGGSIWRAAPDRLMRCIGPYTESDISDQLPYGDWAPGRYAWLLTDAAPVQERCPWCWGDGGDPDSCEALVIGAREVPTKKCRICDGAGRCDPIPARGRQRIWNWTPTP